MQEEHGAERVFGEIAEQYDEVRPGYPPELIADMFSRSGIPCDGRILEIGCGTGKATRLLLPFGRALTCIDPSPGMLAVARRTTAGFPNAEFHESKLEDWTLPGKPFDLAFAAQSFHWIDPIFGIQKVAKALRTNGTFAIFGSAPGHVDTPMSTAIDDAYRRFAPDLHTPSTGVWGEAVDEAINASGLFGAIESRSYRWHTEYDADAWVKLLTTHSDHRILPAARREQLLAAVHAAITAHGGTHRYEVISKLLLTRKS